MAQSNAGDREGAIATPRSWCCVDRLSRHRLWKVRIFCLDLDIDSPVVFMKLYAALVFFFCMGLHGNSQATSKAEVDHADTQRIADPSCDTAASSRPGLSREDALGVFSASLVYAHGVSALVAVLVAVLLHIWGYILRLPPI
jgi:hypothetical protein